MNSEQPRKGFFTKFSGQFWLVVMFEFFERGAYYGMMSFLSQYFVDSLHFPKESVGVIKGVIQPLLYFLPILAGAIADRFGYRKILMVAFTLLGGGYFLTSQMTSYTAVFGALVASPAVAVGCSGGGVAGWSGRVRCWRTGWPRRRGTPHRHRRGRESAPGPRCAGARSALRSSWSRRRD